MEVLDRVALTLTTALLAACAHRPPAPRPAPEAALPTLPRPPGSPAWLEAARRALAAHDADRSGHLEAHEAIALPCPLLVALDADLHGGVGGSLAVELGLRPDLLWRGERLGLDASARAPLLQRLEGCAGPSREATRDMDTLHAIAASSAPPTSEPWDLDVRQALLAAYDADRSGALDTPLELEAIPCPVWLHLEGATLAERNRPLCVVYGLSEGYLFVAGELGVAVGSRADAVRAATSCGLAAD